MVFFQFCAEKEGYLAEIVTKVEQTNMNAILDTDSCYWMGLTDLAAEGKFVWQHSFSPLGEYTNWFPGQPDNFNGDEDCVYQKYIDNWGWNDAICESNANYECVSIHALCQSYKS